MVPRPSAASGILSNAVAITGAGGYLGGLLVRQLVESGHRDVRALSRTPAPWLAVPPIPVELSDRDALAKTLDGVDAVVHLAGANEAIAKSDPDEALAETVVTSRQVGEVCVDVGVPRIVYVSTVHVYGAALQPGATITEDVVPQPRSVYAVARLASEHLLAAVDPDVVIVRLTNAVGAPANPGVDRWSLVSNDLCRQAAVTGELRLHSDGRQWRDFVAVADVCRILATAIEPGALAGGTFNLGTSSPLTILQLAELVQDAAERLTGTRPPLHVPPSEREAIEPYVISTDRLRARGLGAEVQIGDAISETLRFCLEQKDALERGEQ